MRGRWRALVLLGWSFVVVLLQRALRLPRRGLAHFQADYGGEGLSALTAGDRAALPRFVSCIACGRCDLGEGERMAASNGAYPGLMQLVLASSRSMPDFDAAVRGFAFVPDDVLRTRSAVCPTRVPFAEIASFVREQHRLRTRLLGTEPDGSLAT